MANRDEYTVGWICAIKVEYVAAQCFLDEEYGRPDSVAPNDDNVYKLGRVGPHKVAIAVLPDGEYGTSSATGVARDMLHSFPNIRIGLMVGIGGGAPSQIHDIRLGDVVVSAPRSGKGGVYQYDFGKTIQNQEFQPTGFLDQPPRVLRSAVADIETEHERKGHQIEYAIDTILAKNPKLRKKYKRPPPASDRLYDSNVVHPADNELSCEVACGDDSAKLVVRAERIEDDDNPAIYYGIIASANQLMKDALIRDRLARDEGVLCFEMEAAGLMNQFPCLVIRGICDYSDSHKNKEWQGYAAMAAAAYAKELLHRIPSRAVTELDTLRQIQKSGERIENKARTKEIHEWLLKIVGTDINMEHAHSNYVNQRTEGTGEWFLSKPEFREWRKNKARVLYCKGIPGTGKTIIASLVIQELQRRDTQDHEVGVAYFYCSLTRTRSQDIHIFFACLLSQLTSHNKEPPDCLSRLYDSRDPKVNSLRDALISAIESYSNSYIIVDALDEWQKEPKYRMPIVQELLGLYEKTRVKIFVTSRNIDYIEEAFKDSRWGNVQFLEITASEADMKAYLHEDLSASDLLCNDSEASKGLRQECIKCIVGNSNGIFLLTRLRARALSILDTTSDVHDCLAMIREGKDTETSLKDEYDKVIKRLKEAGSLERAIQLFQWIIYARRPITIHEVQHALAIDSRSRSIDTGRIAKRSNILSKDAGLIDENRDGTLSLIHITAQNYLTNERIVTPIAEADIVIACTTYISFQEFEKGRCLSENELRTRKVSHPFYMYASRYWGLHCRSWLNHYANLCEKDEDSKVVKKSEDVQRVLKRFLVEPNCVQASVQAYEFSRNPRQAGLNMQGQSNRLVDTKKKKNGHSKRQIERGTEPLMRGETLGIHLAAIYGLEDILFSLVHESAQNLSSGDNRDNTPLLHAAKCGYEVLVKWIVEQVGEPGVNQKNNHGETPLIIAAIKGHLAVVRILLHTKGLDVDGRDASGKTALAWAAHHGHIGIVGELIETGNALATTWASDGLTPIARAISQGHQGVFRILLDTMMSDTRKKRLGKALDGAFSKACEKGRAECVRVLLNETRNYLQVNPSHKEARCSPLWLATNNKHGDIARILVKEAKANIKQPDKHGVSPLFLAWQASDIELVSFFLEEGTEIPQRWELIYSMARRQPDKRLTRILFQNMDIEIDLNSKSKGAMLTPLAWAVEENYRVLAKVFIKNPRTNINLSDGRGRSPLLIAVEHDNERIVRRLLKQKRIDANAPSYEGLTPLLMAALRGNYVITSILVDSGKVDLEASDKQGRTALHFATQGGFQSIVELLIRQENVGFNTKDYDSLTPLASAIEGGHKHITRHLIESGKMDLGAQDNQGRTLLLVAIERGRKDIAEQLFKSNSALLKVEAHDGRTPLLAAIDKGRKDMVRMLLSDSDNAVEEILSLRDKTKRTPLHAAVESGCLGILSFIIDLSVKVHFKARDMNGYTALHVAIGKGREDLVEVLIKPLEAAASLIERDDEGRTPFCMAVVQEHSKIIQILLGHIDSNRYLQAANMKDTKGRSPLARAVSQGSHKIIEILSKSPIINPNWKTTHGYNSMSLAVIRNRDLEIKKLLLTSGAKLDSQDARGRTPLMHAVAKGHEMKSLKPVYELLELKSGDEDNLGANLGVNLGDEAGHTALIKAVRLDDSRLVLRLVKMLLSLEDLNPNGQCKRGRTALSYACALGHCSIVKLLVSQKTDGGISIFDANLQDANGLTPFTYAERYSHLEIMTLLQDRCDVQPNCQDGG